jgi:hypothetical protein
VNGFLPVSKWFLAGVEGQGNAESGWSDVLTVENFGIERAGYLSPLFVQETCGAIVNRHPRINEIISGIILLAAKGKNPIPLAEIHSFLHEMTSREPILSGLRFSLTGAVCYSRDIDQAIHHLADGGFLTIVGRSAFVGEHAHEFWRYLSGLFTNSQIKAVHSVSLRFHDRLRRCVKDSIPRPSMILHRDVQEG